MVTAVPTTRDQSTAQRALQTRQGREVQGSKGPRDTTSQPLPCAEAALGLTVRRKTSQKTFLNQSLPRAGMSAAVVEFQPV